MSATELTSSDDGILWDIVEEHLEEAEFCFEVWREGLSSPLYTLSELERGPEERLKAHLDGLLIAGPPAAERLLVPALEAPDEPILERSVVAALVLIAMGRADLVWKALSSEDAVIQSAAREAFVLAAPTQFDAWLPDQFAPGAPRLQPRQRVVLLDIAGRRGLTIPDLLAALRADDPDELAAAAVAARLADPARHLAAIEHLVEHEDTHVSDAALVTGLCFGSPYTWQRCRARAANTAAPEPLAMRLVALVGDAQQQAILVEHLSRETHREPALAALSCGGQAALVPALLPLLADENPIVAKLAGAAVTAITGIDTNSKLFVSGDPADESDESDGLPPLEEDDLDADLAAARQEDDLPLPDAHAIASFWQQSGGRFDTRHRLLCGSPWTLASCLDACDSVSLYFRRSLALWLLVRSGGRARLSTHAWSHVQRSQMARARSLNDHALRQFSRW